MFKNTLIYILLLGSTFSMGQPGTLVETFANGGVFIDDQSTEDEIQDIDKDEQ